MCVPSKTKGKRSKTTEKTRTRRTTNKKNTNLEMNPGIIINGILATSADKPKYGPENKRKSVRIATRKANAEISKATNNGRPATMMNKLINKVEERRKPVVVDEQENSLNAAGTRADAEDRSKKGSREDEAWPVFVPRPRKRLPLIEKEYDYDYDTDEKRGGKKAKKSNKDENNNKTLNSRGKSVRIQSTQSSGLHDENTPSSSTQPAVRPALPVTSPATRKRSRSKIAMKSSTDQILEVEKQRAKEKALTEAANLDRNNRHIARSARQREFEERQKESKRENGGSDSDEDQPKRSHRIRRQEAEDMENPFAWRMRTYGKAYDGKDDEHFAVRRF